MAFLPLRFVMNSQYSALNNGLQLFNSLMIINLLSELFCAQASQQSVEYQNLMHVKDSKDGTLYFNSYIGRLTPGFNASLIEGNQSAIYKHAKTVIPQTLNILNEYNNLQTYLKSSNLSNSQAVITQMLSIEKMVDSSTILFENSIGIMNKQQFFSAEEQNLISSSYDIEDTLYHRLVQLANLTCLVVYDDLELLSKNISGFQKNLANANARNNSQYSLLKEFNQLARANSKASQNIFTQEKTLNYENLDLSRYFEQVVKKPYLQQSLQTALGFKFQFSNIKNANFYAEKSMRRDDFTFIDISENRISYRFYKFRFPEISNQIIDNFDNQENYNENRFLFYSNNSQHFKELNDFDEFLIKSIEKKLNNQTVLVKNIQTDEQKQKNKHSNFQTQTSQNYQEKFYKNQGFQNINKQTQNNENYTSNQKYHPFGDFSRELHKVPSIYDYPVKEIQNQEQYRVMQKIMVMKAMHQHYQIFENFKKHFNLDSNTEISKFQSLLFTYEDPETIKTFTQGVKPQKIQDLKENSYFSDFFEGVEIYPRKILIREPIYLLTPYKETFTIKNEDPEKILVIYDVKTSSPDVDALLEPDKEFPITLQQNESLKVQIVVSSQNYGRFDALIYIIFEDCLNVMTLKANVIPNKFGLEPQYWDRVQLKTEVAHSVNVANPYPIQLQIEEFYLTNKKFEAKIVKPIIEPNSNDTSFIINYKAQDQKPDIEQTMVAIKFKTGDYLRMPVIIRTINSLVEVSPVIIDFGLVQLYQQPLKMEVWVTINVNNIQKIVDFHLPINEENLDFKLFDPIDLSSKIGDKLFKFQSERQKRQRKPIIDQNGFTKFLLGYVYLNPIKSKLIVTSIKMEVELKEARNSKDQFQLFGQSINKMDVFSKIENSNNGSIFIDIPIIGSIVNHTSLLSAVEITNSERTQSSEPIPLYLMDHGLTQLDYDHNKTSVHQVDLMIKNNLQNSLNVQKIFYSPENNYVNDSFYQDENPFYKLKYHDKSQQILVKLKRFHHSSGQIISYGRQELHSKQNYFRNSQIIIWIQVNNVLIPQQIQSFNRELKCFQSSQIVSYNTNNFQDKLLLQAYKNLEQLQNCQQINNQNFGMFTTGIQRYRIIKLHNPNPVQIGIEKITKQQKDEFSIEVLKIEDRRGQMVDPIWQSNSVFFGKQLEYPFELLASNCTQSETRLLIQPFQTIYMKIKVFSFNENTKQGKINIKFSPKIVENIEVEYSYQIVDSKINFQPGVALFKQGMNHYKVLTTTSNYSSQVQILDIQKNDERIQYQLLNDLIRPWNFTICMNVSFNTHLSDINQKHTQIIQLINQIIVLSEKEASENQQNSISFFEQCVLDQEQNQNQIQFLTQDIINQLELIEFQENLHHLQNNVINFKSKEQIELQCKEIESKNYLVQKSIDILKQNLDFGNLNIFGYPDQNFKIEHQINYKDLCLWYEREEKWKIFENQGKNLVTSELNAYTQENGMVNLPVVSFIYKPSILTSQNMTFGKVQIGQSVYQDIELTNPTEKSIQVQLFIGFDIQGQFFESDGIHPQKHEHLQYNQQIKRQLELYMEGLDIDIIHKFEQMSEAMRSVANEHLRLSRQVYNRNNKIFRFSKEDVYNIMKSFINSDLQIDWQSNQKLLEKFDSYLKSNKEYKNVHISKTDTYKLTVEEMLSYWKFTDYFSFQQNHYISEYCSNIFQDFTQFNTNFQLKDFYLDQINKIQKEYKLFNDWNMYNMSQKQMYFANQKLYLNDKINPMSLCLISITQIHITNQKCENQEKQEFCQRDDFQIQNIQNLFQILHERVFDFDWKINQSVQVEQIIQNLLNWKNLKMDEIQETLQNIQTFQHSLNWKKNQVENLKFNSQQKSSLDQIFGIFSKLEEKYISLLTKSVPFNDNLVQMPQILDEMIQTQKELLKLDILNDLLYKKFNEMQLNEQINMESLNVLMNLQKSKVEQEMANVENFASQLQQEQLESLNVKFYQNVFDAIKRMIYAINPSNWKTKDNYNNQQTQNSLGCLSARFYMKNKFIQLEMIKNNIAPLIGINEGKKQPKIIDLVNLKYKNRKPNFPFYEHSKDSQQFVWSNFNHDDKINQFQQKNFRNIQSFFINPIYRGQIFTIEPKQNLTIKNAIVFEPTLLYQVNQNLSKLQNKFHQDKKQLGTNLLLKNNYTFMEKISLEGHGSTAFLEVVDIQKDFVTILNEKDEQGLPISIQERISVFRSKDFNLSAFQDIIENIQHDKSNKLYNLTQIRQFEESISKNNYFRETYNGTDLYLFNSLFDSQFWQEFPSEDTRIFDQLKNASISQSEQNMYQMLQLERAFLRWNQNEKVADFSYQNYQNLIVFNIPFTDIVRKPALQLENKDQLYLSQDSQRNQLFQLVQIIKNIDFRSNQTRYQEQIKILHDQRKIRQNIIDNSGINLYVGWLLNRWDPQDFRVDIDWKEMLKQINQGNVDIEYKHTRYIVLQNTGTLPLNIKSIKLDGHIFPCHSPYRGKLKINNCKQLLNKTFQNGQNITIQVQLNEDFIESFRSQVLEIETEFFSQKFLFEFQFPQKAKDFILNIENTKKSINLGGGVLSLPSLIENLFFMICLIYFTLLMASGIRKDFDINTGHYFYHNKQDQESIEKQKKFSIELQNKLKKEYKQIDTNKIQKQQKLKSEFPKLEDQQNIPIQDLSFQQIFEQFCKKNFVQDVLPTDIDNRFLQKQINPIKSYFLDNFDTAQYLIENAFYKFQTESLKFNLKPDTILLQAQNFSNLKKGPDVIIKASQKKNERKKSKLNSQNDDVNKNLEIQIMEEMSKIKNFDEENTGIRFFKNDKGEIEFQFVKLNDMSPKSKQNLDIIGFSLKIEEGQDKNFQMQSIITPSKNYQQNKLKTEIQKVEINQVQKKQDLQPIKTKQKYEDLQVLKSSVEGNESSSYNQEIYACEQDKSSKQVKVKKLNKKDLKKREARLKKEQELIENTKRIQIQEQKLNQLQIQKETKDQDYSFKVADQIDSTTVQNIQVLNNQQKDFEIKSYHSSEEEIKIKKKNEEQKLRQAQKEDLKMQKAIRNKQFQSELQIENQDIILKKERSSSFRPNYQEQSYNFWQSYEQKLAEQKNIITKIPEKQLIFNIDNEIKKELSEEKQQLKDELIMQEQEESSQKISDANKNSNEKEIQQDQIDDKQPQEVNESVKDEEDAHTIQNQINYNSHTMQNSAQEIEDEEDLPLFQQKKYLEKQLNMQKQINLNQVNESSFNESEDLQIIKHEQVESYPNQAKHSSIDDKVHRKLNEKNRKVFDEDKIYSENSQQKYNLIKSKNPHADINNPNNPNYKGRLGKTTQAQLKNQQIQKKDYDNFTINEKTKTNKIYQTGKNNYLNQKYDNLKDVDQYEEDEYNIFYQSNKSHLRDENIQDDYDDYYQNKNSRFKDYYISEKSKNYDDFQQNKFYESSNKFKSTVLNYNYDNEIDYKGRYQDFKKKKYNKDQSDSDDNQYYYQGFKVKGRNQGRYVTIVEDPRKKKFEERLNPDSKYGKYRGYNENRNDIYFKKHYRDVSREEKIYKKDWQKDIYDQNEYGEEIQRGRQRVNDNKYYKEEEQKKYYSNMKYKNSYEDDFLESKEERQVIEKQRENTQESLDEQYDHDQVMLMRRARGRAFNATDISKYGRGERMGRGDKISNYIQRGSIRGTNDFRFSRGRGAPYFSLQQEMYKFKPKEKDNQENNQKNSEKNEQGELYKQSQTQNFNEGVGEYRKQIQQNNQNIDYENNQNENIEEEEDQQIKKIKSIYETFMDVSSIFSNPVLQFKGQDQKKQKPRFFDDFDDEESDQEQNQTQKTQLNYDHNYKSQIEKPEQYSLFSNLGQNIWFNNKSSIIEQENEDEFQNNENQADSLIYQQNKEEDFNYLKSNAVSTKQENEVGLSSSSLANLRKRALDPKWKDNDLEQQKSQSKQNDGNKKFVNLAALPVPKFIQEQQARKQQYHSIFEENDSYQ